MRGPDYESAATCYVYLLQIALSPYSLHLLFNVVMYTFSFLQLNDIS